MTGSAAQAVPTVRIERIFPAPPDIVFAAWLDADTMATWMSPRGNAEIHLDPVVGGLLRVVMVDGDTRIQHDGSFLDILPPRRLSFTWSSQYTGGAPSIVTVELTPVDGGTRLVLVHERLPAEVVAGHAGGWGTILERLADRLRGSTSRTGPSA